MTVNLSNLQNTNRKKGKRRGRGDGSGRGTYATRGLKGQRSRSGGRKNLKRRGLKGFLQQIPKQRGFKSFFAPLEVVNLDSLQKNFEAGEQVTPDKIKAKGLVRSTSQGVKILGNGKLSKKLFVTADSFSKSAVDAIKKAGGEAKQIKKS